MTSTTPRQRPATTAAQSPHAEICPVIAAELAANAELIQAVRGQAAAIHHMFMSTIGAAVQTRSTIGLGNAVG